MKRINFGQKSSVHLRLLSKSPRALRSSEHIFQFLQCSKRLIVLLDEFAMLKVGEWFFVLLGMENRTVSRLKVPSFSGDFRGSQPGLRDFGFKLGSIASAER